MAEYITKKFVRDNFPKRIQNSNKSTFGRILNIAGSGLYYGAAYLSSISALKAGAGFVTLASVPEVINSAASLAPEITFCDFNNVFDVLSKYNVISIGCGLGVSDELKTFTDKLIKSLLPEQKIVLDADALNILSLFDKKPSIKNSVITPHPLELSRLLNVELTEILENREKYARIASQTLDCITVLKGHNTIITDGDKVYINTTGNSALAKAGTGDVLTGIISSLAAQGCNCLTASIIGVYLHGLSGDIASDLLTEYGVLASDVINNIPFAIKSVLFED